jgi:TonB family protein
MRVWFFSTIAILLVSGVCNAQSIETNYFADKGLTQKVAKNKAGYIENIIAHPDGTKMITVTNAKNGDVIRQETYRGAEPIGKWTVLMEYAREATELDYDFKVVYGDPKRKRADSSNFIPAKMNRFPLTDNDSIDYIAPRISTGEKSLNIFVQKNIAYPFTAIVAELQGTVQVRFVVTEHGAIEDIEVVKPVNILLDKEAVRIVKLLKFSSGPMLKGENKRLLLILPIVFRLG